MAPILIPFPGSIWFPFFIAPCHPCKPGKFLLTHQNPDHNRISSFLSTAPLRWCCQHGTSLKMRMGMWPMSPPVCCPFSLRTDNSTAVAIPSAVPHWKEMVLPPCLPQTLPTTVMPTNTHGCDQELLIGEEAFLSYPEDSELKWNLVDIQQTSGMWMSHIRHGPTFIPYDSLNTIVVQEPFCLKTQKSFNMYWCCSPCFWVFPLIVF